MNKLTIIIPSRKQKKQIHFLKKATESVRKQTIANQFNITFLVGVDKGCMLDSAVSEALEVKCIESDGSSQAEALNVAIRQVHDGFCAFLEDDDQWMPEYLSFAIKAIAFCDFVSSTQLEVNESDEFIKINDFPTPSGWFMPTSILKEVGEFNELFKIHLDNEWLGRLSEANFKRIHMVESTSPIDLKNTQLVRPWLAKVLNLGGFVKLVRHGSPYPLVRRLVHPNSGISQISSNAEYAELSDKEYKILISRFGKIPW